jgi:hypothetical protein
MEANTLLGIALAAVVVLTVAVSIFVRRTVTRERAAFIQRYVFPARLEARVRELHPYLPAGRARLAIEGLRQYFLACLAAQSSGIARHVGMPSRAVDDAWHEFLLMKREYAEFCREAFGRELVHLPNASMTTPMHDALANTLHQLRRDSPAPGGWAMLGAMPLLFALDRELGVKDGFHHDAASLDQLEHRRVRNAAGASCGAVSGSVDCAPSAASCDAGGSCGGGGCGSS